MYKRFRLTPRNARACLIFGAIIPYAAYQLSLYTDVSRADRTLEVEGCAERSMRRAGAPETLVQPAMREGPASRHGSIGAGQ